MTAAAGRPRSAVFLDRDGTVIEDRHYLADPEGVRLLPGAAESIAALNRAGVTVVLVTNQSGIGRGLFSAERFAAVQLRLGELLAAAGARFDAVYHCPHAPEDSCHCRKPAPGLFLRAAEELGLDLPTSTYVGDRMRDLECGIALGGRAFLVGGAREASPPGVEVAGSLVDVVRRVLGKPLTDSR
jgi:D-glycero-D-manno-heptose 1,7-bisphosphate phosphatase